MTAQKVIPTPNQWKAISDLDSHLAITAGAGAGKTWVLTERYAAMLAGRPLVDPPRGFEPPPKRKPCRPREIVAITFTREAATEMKTRIRRRLLDWQREEPEQSRLIEQHMEELEDAVVSTIHGFCGELIRTFPLQAGVDPQFQVIEPDESRDLLEESIRAILDRGVNEEDEAVLRLLQQIPYEQLVGEWLDFYPALREYSEDFIGISQRSISRLQGGLEKLPDLIERFRSYLSRLLAVDAEELPDKPKLALQLLQKKWLERWEKVWENWISSDLYYTEEVFEIFHYLQDNVWGTSKIIREYMEPLREALNEIQKNMSSHELEQVLMDTGNVLTRIHHDYEARKFSAGCLDFTDLQSKAVSLIDHAKVQESLQHRIKYLMVDEFQDTNPVQFHLLKKMMNVLPDLRVFIVGDSKQSIYRFRGADVELFIRSQRMIREKQGKVINLEENYRSQASVISTVNHVFHRVMHPPDVEGLPLYSSVYDFAMKSTQPDHHHSAKVEMLHVGTKSVQDEARAIALRIQQMTELEERIPFQDKEGVRLRHVRYGDIAVLFSSTNHVPVFEQAFQSAGIPYYVVGSRNFFRRQEIWDIFELMQTLNREDDVLSLIAVLRSPFFQLSDETLYWLGHGKKLLEFWNGDGDEVLKDIIEEKERQKLIHARQKLSKWRGLSREETPYVLLNRILEETGYEQILFMMPSGTQRVGNVRKFVQLVAEKEKQGYVTLRKLVPYLRRLIDRGADEEEAQVESADSNVVKIMTIHKSKGLEFPVVFLPNLQKTFHMKYSRFSFDPELGMSISLDHEDYKKMGIAAAIKERERDKDREEEKRKLYVGMTRARDLLVLSCASPIPKSKTVYDLDRSNWWSWLVYAMANGQIQGIQESLQEFPVSIHYRYVEDPEQMIDTREDRVNLKQSDEDSDIPVTFPQKEPEWFRLDRKELRFIHPPTMTVSEILKNEYESKNEQRDIDEILNEDIARERLDSNRMEDFDYGESPVLQYLNNVPSREGLSAAEKGTLIHLILEHWPIRGEEDSAQCEKRIRQIIHNKLIEWGRFDTDLDEAVKQISPHLNTIRGARFLKEAAASPRVWRELPFLYKEKGQRDQEHPDRLISGTIDLVYQIEDGKAVVVDYKTNDISKRSVHELTRFYQRQLDLYADVVERVLGLDVSRKVLFFTDSGDEVEL